MRWSSDYSLDVWVGSTHLIGMSDSYRDSGLVRCTDRIPFNHSIVYRSVGTMVEEPR